MTQLALFANVPPVVRVVLWRYFRLGIKVISVQRSVDALDTSTALILVSLFVLLPFLSGRHSFATHWCEGDHQQKKGKRTKRDTRINAVDVSNASTDLCTLMTLMPSRKYLHKGALQTWEMADIVEGHTMWETTNVH